MPTTSSTMMWCKKWKNWKYVCNDNLIGKNWKNYVWSSSIFFHHARKITKVHFRLGSGASNCSETAFSSAPRSWCCWDDYGLLHGATAVRQTRMAHEARVKCGQYALAIGCDCMWLPLMTIFFRDSRLFNLFTMIHQLSGCSPGPLQWIQMKPWTLGTWEDVDYPGP